MYAQVLSKELCSRVNARLELLFFFFRDSFLQYNVFADIRRGSVGLQRREETGQDRTKVTVDD